MVKDTFSNKFYGTVTESAANTLTFAEIQTNVNVFSKMAWVVSALEFYLTSIHIDYLTAAGDFLQVALTSSDQMSELSLSDPGVIDLLELDLLFNTNVGAQLYSQPFRRDFSNMPGGGLLIAPRPLFLAVEGTSLALPIAAQLRGFFTIKELKADEYLELVDFYRIVK